MKKFILLSLAILAIGCKKVDVNGPTVLKSIAFAKTEVSLEAGESEAFVINPTPAKADIPKLIFESSAPGVATVNGSKIVGISEGQAVITATVKDKPEIYCKCNVTVSPFIDAVPVTSLSLGKSEVELSDLGDDGEADHTSVAVQVEPANVSWKDLIAYSEDADIEVTPVDGDPLSLRISVTPNKNHETTNVRAAKVFIKAKKGTAEKTLTVNVRGHISGFEIPLLSVHDPADYHFDFYQKRIQMLRTETYALKVDVQKTGTLRSDETPFILSSESPARLAISISGDKGMLKVPSSAAVTGNKDPIYVTVSCNKNYLKDVLLPVYTYEEPTSYSYKSDLTDNILYPNRNYRLILSTQPEKSLLHVKFLAAPEGIAEVEYDNLYSNTVSISFRTGASGTSGTASFSPVSNTYPTLGGWTYKIDDFKADEIKIGDYVYYNASTGNFDWSDGGLRAMGSGWERSASVAPVSSKGTFIGLVYQCSIEDEKGSCKIKLNGLGGKNVAVISSRDAIYDNDPDNGNRVYTTDLFDIPGAWGLNTSTYPLPTLSERRTWDVNQGIDKYNNEKATSVARKIRAIYTAQGFGQNKTGCIFVRIGDSKTAGSTGWLLPTYNDAVNILSVKRILKKNIVTALGALGSSKVDMFGENYWTATYVDSQKAYFFKLDSDAPIQVGRNTVCKNRPILLL